MRSHRMNRPAAALTLAAVAVVAGPARAVDIIPVYPTLTTAQRLVVDFAIAEFESALADKGGVMVIHFSYDDLSDAATESGPGVEVVLSTAGGNGPLAHTTAFVQGGDGKPAATSIVYNTQYDFYEGVGKLENWTSENQIDLFSVTRHELGHSLGFTANWLKFASNVTPGPGAKNTYNAGGVPTATLTHWAGHLDPETHPDLLMIPAIRPCTRRSVSQLTWDILNHGVWNPNKAPLECTIPFASCGVLVNDPATGCELLQVGTEFFLLDDNGGFNTNDTVFVVGYQNPACGDQCDADGCICVVSIVDCFVISQCVTPILECGEIVEGPTCPIFVSASGPFILDDYGGFGPGCSVQVDGTRDPECQTLCLEVTECICVNSISVCPASPFFNECGEIIADADCEKIFRSDSQIDYHLSDYKGFEIGCYVRVVGWSNFCSNTCNPASLCICVSFIQLCNSPASFSGCGVLVEGPDQGCRLLFQPDSGGTYDLSNYSTYKHYDVGCRVNVSGTIRDICDPQCTTDCPEAVDGCITGNTIDPCPDGDCENGAIFIDTLVVTADTDPAFNCPDVYVDMKIVSQACTVYAAETTTERGKCPGDTAHEGEIYMADAINPVDFTYTIWDEDVLVDDKMASDRWAPDTGRCQTCVEKSGSAANAEICVRFPTDNEELGDSNAVRILPLFAVPNDLILIGLTFNGSGVVDQVILEEQIPEDFVYQGDVVGPLPDTVEPLDDDEGVLGTLLTWNLTNPTPGMPFEVVIIYEVLTPIDRDQIAQAFRSRIVSETRARTTAMPLVDVVIGGLLNDCNGNLVEDILDIFTGFSQDLDNDGVPDECNESKPCPWDCQAVPDGNVSTSDLLTLLGQWGGPGSCDFDGGIVSTADLLELLGAWGPCPAGSECGPGNGNCCVDNGTPGCDDAACCDEVCAADSFCCDVAWDIGCVSLAQFLCAICGAPSCGDPEAGDCCIPNGTPGCDDFVCCDFVCNDIDIFCCDVEWDSLCAGHAMQFCGICP